MTKRTVALVAGVFGLAGAGAGAIAFHGSSSASTASRASTASGTSTASTPSKAAFSASPTSEARLVLERHCGVCHREDSPEAKRGALAVFNLNKADWSASMSDERLPDARNRLRDMQPRGRGDDRALDGAFGGTTTSAEVAAFDAFVDAELARRRN